MAEYRHPLELPCTYATCVYVHNEGPFVRLVFGQQVDQNPPAYHASVVLSRVNADILRDLLNRWVPAQPSPPRLASDAPRIDAPADGAAEAQTGKS